MLPHFSFILTVIQYSVNEVNKICTIQELVMMLADSQRVMLLTATISYVQFYLSLSAAYHSVTEIFYLNRSFHRSFALQTIDKISLH